MNRVDAGETRRFSTVLMVIVLIVLGGAVACTSAGPNGERGAAGISGTAGTPGPIGPVGDTGAPGAQGPEGVPPAAATIVANGAGRKWSDNTLARGCYGYRYPSGSFYRYAGLAGDGVYTVDPDGPGGIAEFDAYCDMTGQGGGWAFVAGIASANSVHVDAAQVAAGNLLNPTGKGKFADVVINNMKSGVSPAFRLSCAAVTGYFPASCDFRAGYAWTGTGTPTSCNEVSYTYPVTRFDVPSAPQIWATGIAAQNVVYGRGPSGGSNGCYSTATGWGQDGTLWVR